MHILVIEDDARVADFLTRGLRAEAHQITHCTHGREGLQLARQSTADLLLLDIMLPELSGIDICQTLRSEGYQAPILMLSALASVEDRVAGLRCGADDYLSKPFSFEELLARIEALARRVPQARGQVIDNATVLQVDDLVFDRERMQVQRAGTDIRLTAKELALLELLMRHPGRLYSRERILSNVWGAAEDPLTNVVDVYVRRLRAKVDEGYSLPLIKTVRGLGYKLDAT